MTSTYGQPNWSIFAGYVRMLERGRLPGTAVFNSSMSLLAGWFALAAFFFVELYTYFNDIWLGFGSLLLMIASSRVYLQLVQQKKGRNGGSSNTRGGWTGFGISGSRWAAIIIVVAVILIASSVTGGLSWLATQVFKSGGALYSPGTILPAGTANCPGSGTYAYGAQPSNCLPIGMNLQIALKNAASTAALSGWTCQVIWGTGNIAVSGATPGTPGTIAETVANTPSTGLCSTTQNLYYPSWSLQVRVCHQTTACSNGSPTYAQQEYVAVVPLPGGTVPFYYGTQAPTTTWTQPFTVNVVPMAGDIAASATPITMKFAAQNGTTIATAQTCYTNLANGNGGTGCFFGTGVYITQFTIYLTNTFTSSSFPYIAGYTPFSDPILGVPQLGTLSTNIQLEVKQTAGTNPICTLGTATSGFTNAANPYIKAASVPDVIYVSGDLSSALTVNKSNGYTTTSTGTTSISLQANCQTLTAASHGDTDTFTFNLYAYYSPSWVAGNSGTLNTITAVTQMSQFVITMSS